MNKASNHPAAGSRISTLRGASSPAATCFARAGIAMALPLLDVMHPAIVRAAANEPRRQAAAHARDLQ